MQSATISAICFDLGGTLMSEDGPQDISIALWPHVQATAGAADCLASLAGRFPLCIATNASVSNSAMIRRALERVNFAHYFSHIFCYTDLGYRKGQPSTTPSRAAASAPSRATARASRSSGKPSAPNWACPSTRSP